MITATPEPVAPIGGAPTDSTASEFRWKATPKQTYHLQIAADDTFKQLVVDTPVGSTDSITLYNVFKPDGKTRYWRIGSTEGEAWSEPTPFVSVTDTQAAQAQAKLVAQAETLATESISSTTPVSETNAAVPLYLYQTTSAASLNLAMAVLLITLTAIGVILATSL